MCMCMYACVCVCECEVATTAAGLFAESRYRSHIMNTRKRQVVYVLYYGCIRSYNLR